MLAVVVLPCVPATAIDLASAQIDASAWIGPGAVVEAETVVGPGAFVGPGCVIGRGCRIGAGSRLVARVTLCRGTQLGERVLVHPGAVLGSDGFGLANDGGVWVKVPQLGRVRVGDDVEIGANTTIDRGALDDTVIGDGVKLDNQIQIGHNVEIGEHCAIAACAGISGSTRLGRHCTLGGGVGLAGHLEFADNVHFTGQSLVTRSFTKPGVYTITVSVTDDDGGSDLVSFPKIVTDDFGEVRSQGFWRRQFADKKKNYEIYLQDLKERCRDAGAVEEVAGEADNALQQVLPDDGLAEVRFKLMDDGGLTLDRDGVTTPGPVSTSFVSVKGPSTTSPSTVRIIIPRPKPHETGVVVVEAACEPKRLEPFVRVVQHPPKRIVIHALHDLRRLRIHHQPHTPQVVRNETIHRPVRHDHRVGHVRAAPVDERRLDVSTAIRPSCRPRVPRCVS